MCSILTSRFKNLLTCLLDYKNSLLKSSIILFSVAMVGGGLNYLFQIIVGRFLSIENYAVFQSLLAFIVIISVPKETLTYMTVKKVSSFSAQSRLDSVKSLYYFLLKSLAKVCVLSFIVYLLFIPVISSFLKIESKFLLALVGLIFCSNIVYPVNLGVIQGLKEFIAHGIISLSGTILKLLLSVILLFYGFKVGGALGAIVISGIFLFVVSFFFIKKINGNVDFSDKPVRFDFMKSGNGSPTPKI